MIDQSSATKAEIEQHFSFQRAQLLSDQSQDDNEDIDFSNQADFTGAIADQDNQNLTGDLMSEDQDQDYGQSFAEEYRLKQEKMLGEL